MSCQNMEDDSNLKDIYASGDRVDDEDFYKDEDFSEFLNKTMENLATISLNSTSVSFLSMKNPPASKTQGSPSASFAQDKVVVLNKSKENLERISLNRTAAVSTSDADLEFQNFLGGLKKKLFNVDFKESNSVSPLSLKNAPASKTVQSPTASSSSAQAIGDAIDGKRSSSLHILSKIEEELRHDFGKNRAVGAKKLYKVFNEKIFDSKLPEDMVLEWSVELRTTAGKTCSVRKGNCYVSCKIILSTKVLTTFERLRDTLLHEMCHAAVFLISQVSGENHGPLWKAWAVRCNLVLPDIEIPQRCHSYDLSYPYYYKCNKCEWKIGRHRRNIKLSEVCCPKCKSSLSLVKS